MKNVQNQIVKAILSGAAAVSLAFGATPAFASETVFSSQTGALSYADLADLAESSTVVARVKIRQQIALPPERAPNMLPGWVRLYIEADTESVLYGAAALGPKQRYLVDVRVDANGTVPKLTKRSFVLFAQTVPGRAGELRLVKSTSQIPAEWVDGALVRSILTEMAATDAPPAITGIQHAMSVPGNLAGESETQIFAEARDGALVSLTVLRRPGMAPQWGVSWTEIVDQTARPPQRDTLEWYRLACFLPARLPEASLIASDAWARQQSATDYQLILDALGPCDRKM